MTGGKPCGTWASGGAPDAGVQAPGGGGSPSAGAPGTLPGAAATAAPGLDGRPLPGRHPPARGKHPPLHAWLRGSGASGGHPGQRRGWPHPPGVLDPPSPGPGGERLRRRHAGACAERHLPGAFRPGGGGGADAYGALFPGVRGSAPDPATGAAGAAAGVPHRPYGERRGPAPAGKIRHGPVRVAKREEEQP